jgi:hypothetical protein
MNFLPFLDFSGTTLTDFVVRNRTTVDTVAMQRLQQGTCVTSKHVKYKASSCSSRSNKYTWCDLEIPEI